METKLALEFKRNSSHYQQIIETFKGDMAKAIAHALRLTNWFLHSHSKKQIVSSRDQSGLHNEVDLGALFKLRLLIKSRVDIYNILDCDIKNLIVPPSPEPNTVRHGVLLLGNTCECYFTVIGFCKQPVDWHPLSVIQELLVLQINTEAYTGSIVAINKKGEVTSAAPSILKG